MKTLLTRWLWTVACGGLLVVPLAWSMGPGGQSHPDPHRMLSRLSEHLALTEQQESQVREILAQSGDQARADRKRAQTLREALEQQHLDFNAGEAQRLADELGEVTSRMAYTLTSALAQVYGVLTEDQRAEFERLRAEHRSRGHHRYGKYRE